MAVTCLLRFIVNVLLESTQSRARRKHNKYIRLVSVMRFFQRMVCHEP